jgi:hypothetical protein
MSKAIITSLLPGTQYNFHTKSGQVTNAVLPHVYLEMFKESDPLDMITIDTGGEEKTAWLSNNTMGEWNEDIYANIVFSIIGLIDISFDAENATNDEFIPQAINDALTPIEAVNSWLSDALDGTKIIVSRHVKDMLDIELTSTSGQLSVMRRVVIDQKPNKGDMFNVYYGDSSKGGAIFNRDILTSVTNFLRDLEEDIVEKPCDEYLTIYKRAQDVGLCILQNQGYTGAPEAFNSNHENIRVRSAFKTACDILEMLQQHEMSDIVEEVEAYRQSQS